MTGYNGSDRIRRRRRDGYGEGQGENYKPWLTVRSFGSRGNAHRLLTADGRAQHLLSTLEYKCALLLAWSDVINDVREQFPLHELAETKEIAHELGYKHPEHHVRRNSRMVLIAEPMTTDFLVDFVDRDDLPPNLAVSVKTSTALLDTPRKVDRVLEKAEIERRYWARRGVPFVMVTEEEMPKTLVENIDLVLGYRDLDGFGFVVDEVPETLDYLFDRISRAPTVPLNSICAAADEQQDLPPGSALVLVWHALGTKCWRTDMHKPISADQPLEVCWGRIPPAGRRAS